jgi:hypothetical protein
MWEYTKNLGAIEAVRIQKLRMKGNLGVFGSVGDLTPAPLQFPDRLIGSLMQVCPGCAGRVAIRDFDGENVFDELSSRRPFDR